MYIYTYIYIYIYIYIHIYIYIYTQRERERERWDTCCQRCRGSRPPPGSCQHEGGSPLANLTPKSCVGYAKYLSLYLNLSLCMCTSLSLCCKT